MVAHPLQPFSSVMLQPRTANVNVFAKLGTKALFILLLLLSQANARKMHNIYWNTTNPMFRIDNTDHIIDINSGGNLPTEYDQANIICPRYRKGTRQADIEKYIIYNVSRDEYENCRMVAPNPRIIAVCDKPYDLIYFTITFRSFTPTPGGLEFKPGVDYYFISTSSRSDLYRQVGGRCTSNNMKMVFKIADKEALLSHKAAAVNVPRTAAPSGNSQSADEGQQVLLPDQTVITEHNVQSDVRRPKLPGLKDFHSYLYPTRNFEELDSNSVDHSKRSQGFAEHPNDVIKQEASVMHSGATRQVHVRSNYSWSVCIGAMWLLTLLLIK